jgi:hypothetical protein
MKASRIHYFFAQEWPIKIWMTAVPSVFAIYAALRCWPLFVSPTSWFDWPVIVGIILLAAMLGYFVGILLGWPIIGPLYYDRSVRNGEPFHAGDMVQILVGPHRDRVVRVIKAFDCGAYAGGHRITVDLGAEEEDFRSHQILRMSGGAEPCAESEGSGVG